MTYNVYVTVDGAEEDFTSCKSLAQADRTYEKLKTSYRGVRGAEIALYDSRYGVLMAVHVEP